MPLSTKQVQDICCAHGGAAQCRYLLTSQGWPTVYQCAKLSVSQRKTIDQECDEAIEQARKNKIDITKQNKPIADPICSGYLRLNHVTVGYDQP